MADGENEALLPRCRAGVDSENDGYGDYYDVVYGTRLPNAVLRRYSRVREATIRVIADGAFNPDSVVAQTLGRYGETVASALRLTSDREPLTRHKGFALLTQIGKAWIGGRMATPLAPDQREAILARLREGLLDADPLVQRACIAGVVAWRDRGAIPFLEKLFRPPVIPYDAPAALSDAARVARAALLAK